MRYHLQWKVYRRAFSRPLETAYGVWRERCGVVVRLEDSAGRVGFGEAAPLEPFGGESLQSVLSTMREAHAVLDSKSLQWVMDQSPCCAFALGSAMWMLEKSDPPDGSWANTALLSTGAQGLRLWSDCREQGYSRAKWKIGVQDAATDIHLLKGLADGLLPDCRLRLDANGALTPAEFKLWCSFLPSWGGLDFLEQPLPAGEESAMQALSVESGVPLALDESLSCAHSAALMALRDNWTGRFVLKPSLLGDPRIALQHWLPAKERCVFSSGFETGIGWWAILRMAEEWGLPEPIGAGWLDVFSDGCTVVRPGPKISGSELTWERLQGIWNTL